MVMLPSNVACDTRTNRCYLYTQGMIEQDKLNGEVLFLDVPNDVSHFKMCSEYFPLNLFSYKLKNALDAQEGVSIVEFGEEPIISKNGAIVVLRGVYRFIVREVCPLRDADLHKLLLANFLEHGKEQKYPPNAPVLVMVPFMPEDSSAEDIWHSVGCPMDPLESASLADIDLWILQVLKRDGYFGGMLSAEQNSTTRKEMIETGVGSKPHTYSLTVSSETVSTLG